MNMQRYQRERKKRLFAGKLADNQRTNAGNFIFVAFLVAFSVAYL